MDVVEQAQQTFELKPTLPDFYNILLERPRQDPDGYGKSAVHSCAGAAAAAAVPMLLMMMIMMTSSFLKRPAVRGCFATG